MVEWYDNEYSLDIRKRPTYFILKKLIGIQEMNTPSGKIFKLKLKK